MPFYDMLLSQIVVIGVISVAMLIAATVASWLMLRESRLMLRDVLDLVPDESMEWTDV